MRIRCYEKGRKQKNRCPIIETRYKQEQPIPQDPSADEIFVQLDEFVKLDRITRAWIELN